MFVFIENYCYSKALLFSLVRKFMYFKSISLPGCSISVVCVFWEHEGRVRFSAARIKEKASLKSDAFSLIRAEDANCFASARESKSFSLSAERGLKRYTGHVMTDKRTRGLGALYFCLSLDYSPNFCIIAQYE